MTDNMFTTVGEEPSASQGRTLIVGGAVAAAAVLAAGGWFLLGGSGSSSDESGVVVAHRPLVTSVTRSVGNAASTSKAIKSRTQVPAVSAVQLGRDPFLALYVQPASMGTSTPASAGPTTTPAGGTGTTPTTQPAVTTYAMKLTRVYGSGKQLTAVFTVGSKTQLAKVGSVFGATQELKLLSLQQGTKGAWTAVVQEGDGQPFDAAAGQTMYVR